MTKKAESGVQVIGGQQRAHKREKSSWGLFFRELNLTIFIPCVLILSYLIIHICFPKLLWFRPEYQANKNARAIDAAVLRHAEILQQTENIVLQDGATIRVQELLDSGALLAMPTEPVGGIYGTYGEDKKFKADVFMLGKKTKFKIPRNAKEGSRQAPQPVEEDY